MEMTLGSLFDGSGGFPLAGIINGIKPLWAAEIEPYPISVTKARFPGMKHLGSVLDINGAEVAPVDVITFGSPCQDLSIAGKQKGIHDGERSNLFFEAIRIIKEMRSHDGTNSGTVDHIRPRFAVWENVPGAFSSNKGQDFRAVLQAFCEVCDPAAYVPEPAKCKWGKAGCIVGNGYSIAWRVYDAQFWGVPQRRKRIYLIADFASERAGEILFEREGLRGDIAEGGTAWEGVAPDAQGSTIADDRTGIGLDLYNFAVSGDKAVTLNANSGLSANHAGPTVAIPYTLKIRCGCEGGGKGALIQIDKSATLATNNDQYLFQPDKQSYIVRRLTPQECCRLQGFPDWWEDGVEGRDSARYKMWGNGIALPCAVDVLRRVGAAFNIPE